MSEALQHLRHFLRYLAFAVLDAVRDEVEHQYLVYLTSEVEQATVEIELHR